MGPPEMRGQKVRIRSETIAWNVAWSFKDELGNGLHAPRTFTEIARDTEMSNRNCGHAAELERISPFHCEASQLRWRSIVLG